MSAKRAFDLATAAVMLAVTSPIVLVAMLAIRVTSPGPAIFSQIRVGREGALFACRKLRTMHRDTPSLPTHEAPASSVTSIGKVLRATKIDELPQLWSILKGDMSFVGPRPALFNQHDLVALRTERGVHVLAPGLTGWAQINGRDELSVPEKVRLDEDYLRRRSLIFDVQILLKTFFRVAGRHGVAH